MLELFNSCKPVQRYVLAVAIVVLNLLMAVPFTAGAQEQEYDIDIAELKELLPTCVVYKWECFDLIDIKKETVLVQLDGIKCAKNEVGLGSVFLGGRKDSEQLGYFDIEGLAFVWRFGLDGESGYYNYALRVLSNGYGYYYDFSNTNEGESIGPSQNFSCVDRSDLVADQ